jgi:hypothetical protein
LENKDIFLLFLCLSAIARHYLVREAYCLRPSYSGDLKTMDNNSSGSLGTPKVGSEIATRGMKRGKV